MVHRGSRITCHEGGPLQVESERGARFSCQAAKVEDALAALVFDGHGIALGYGYGNVEIGYIVTNDFARTFKA
jgi:hypothetical protein